MLHQDRDYVINPQRLIEMRDALRHRGPDDAGVFDDGNIALGSRRLAILDLSVNGHMPMSTTDGRYHIAYNGEGYNYNDLRQPLVAKGYRFRSESDTETLLNLYAEVGPNMLHWINGMFALAIWDEKERELFLARDRMGVKPLYYTVQEGMVLFASEQKALFAAGVRPEFDPTTWEELLCFRYVAGAKNPFKNVKSLLPGHYLIWKDGRIQIRKWWDLADQVRHLREAPIHEPVEWFRQTFDDAVALRTISDVPVGILLSGGLDSSCVAASLGAQGIRDVATFTVRFKEKLYDEGPLAKEVAKMWGLEHYELLLEESQLFDLAALCSWLGDEPLAHANEPHLYAISRYAKPRVTVLLSGEGADETMGGYVRYRPFWYLSALSPARPLLSTFEFATKQGIAGTLNARLRKLNRLLHLGGMDEAVLFGACDVLPSDLLKLGFQPSDPFAFRRAVMAEAKDLYPGEPIRHAMFLDQHTFLVSILDRNDRTTMGASIECRVPFLDYRLVQGLAALESSKLLRKRENKALLRKAFAKRLPPSVLQHHKWGFGVPWQKYFRQSGRFRELIEGLPDAQPVSDGAFDKTALRRIIHDYMKGDMSQHALIRQLVFVVMWYKAAVADANVNVSARIL